MYSPAEHVIAALILVGLLPVCALGSDQRLDGVWVGTEKLSAVRTDCPKPSHETLPAKIAIAQGGSLLAVVDGYGPGRYTSLRWSGDTLVFEIANKRRGELHLSSDGKTLIEKGSVRRAIELDARMGGLGQPLIDRGRHEALNDVQASQPSHVTGFTPCLDELTGTFHRER
jgi:hypothetical protein